jgi:serine/threonine-protein kinase
MGYIEAAQANLPLVMNSYQLKTIVSRNRCLVCQQEFPIAEERRYCPSDGSLLTSVAEDPFLELVLDGKYKIQEFIGAGGWSRVYKAQHLDLERIVAIKILDGGLVGDPLHLSRFQAEAKATNLLVHPNIVTVYDHGVLPQPFIVMEFVSGRTLDEFIKEKEVLTWKVAFPIFTKVCEAMTYAHKKGFVHRDLTPRNIMLTFEGDQVKVLDFGLVHVEGQKFTRTGETLGSPPYMSPEQCRGEKLAASSDVYSLGCVIYFALTGKRPFEGDTSVESMYKHFNKVPAALSEARPDLHFPKGLDAVIAKALAKQKNDRYQSMQDLYRDLEKVQAGTVAAILFFKRFPTYSQTIKFLARISMFGNVTAVILFVLYQIVMIGR